MDLASFLIQATLPYQATHLANENSDSVPIARPSVWQSVAETCGGLKVSSRGAFDFRGQTRSVPQSPTGMTGAFVRAASLAAPQRPTSTGSKNAGPRGIVP